MSVDTAGKSLVDLLNMLEPAPEPAPVSMMPQTWGWAAIAVILVALVVCAAAMTLRHRHANAYRRLALAELANPGISSSKAAEILRRTALAAYPREQVAGLYGEDWINFISQSSDSIHFSSELSRVLSEAPYRETPANQDLTHLARHWVKSHKPDRRVQ